MSNQIVRNLLRPAPNKPKATSARLAGSGTCEVPRSCWVTRSESIPLAPPGTSNVMRVTLAAKLKVIVFSQDQPAATPAAQPPEVLPVSISNIVPLLAIACKTPVPEIRPDTTTSKMAKSESNNTSQAPPHAASENLVTMLDPEGGGAAALPASTASNTLAFFQ